MLRLVNRSLWARTRPLTRSYARKYDYARDSYHLQHLHNSNELLQPIYDPKLKKVLHSGTLLHMMKMWFSKMFMFNGTFPVLFFVGGGALLLFTYKGQDDVR